MLLLALHEPLELEQPCRRALRFAGGSEAIHLQVMSSITFSSTRFFVGVVKACARG